MLGVVNNNWLLRTSRHEDLDRVVTVAVGTLVEGALNACQRAAVGQLEIALRPFQRLDRGLLVHRQHQCTVGWIKVQPHDLGGFGAGRVCRRYGGSNELSGKYLSFEQFHLLVANC